jgi:transposase-like protein
MALTLKKIQVIEEMYKKGMRISEIAKTLKVNRDTVRKYLKQFYLKRLTSEQPAQTKEQQTLPAIMTVKYPDTPTVVFVEEQESEKLARILAKLNLPQAQALSEDEVKFLVKVIEQHYSKLDKVLQEEVKQGAEAESRKVFLARLNNIIEDALTLGLEMHYIAKQYKEFCERRGISFVDAVKIAMELYAKEDTSSETIMKILGYIAQMNKEKQAEQQSSQASFMNAILLASLIKNMYGR